MYHSHNHIIGWSSFFIWLGCNILSGGLYIIDLYILPMFGESPFILAFDGYLSIIIHVLMVISLIVGIAVAIFTLREKYAAYKEKKLNQKPNEKRE